MEKQSVHCESQREERCLKAVGLQCVGLRAEREQCGAAVSAAGSWQRGVLGAELGVWVQGWLLLQNSPWIPLC